LSSPQTPQNLSKLLIPKEIINFKKWQFSYSQFAILKTVKQKHKRQTVLTASPDLPVPLDAPDPTVLLDPLVTPDLDEIQLFRAQGPGHTDPVAKSPYRNATRTSLSEQSES
jgi:hypothetical protein